MEIKFTVIGDWVIDNKSGIIKHKLCGRTCIGHYLNGSGIHTCGSEDVEENEMEIPFFIVTLSETIKLK